jgi:transcriptional regulator with XRE-family HTH domain
MVRTRLAAKRRELGLSQEEMARALEVDRSTYARWERGEVTDLRPAHRRRLAALLSIAVPSVDALLLLDEDRSDDSPAGGVEHLRAEVAHLVELDGRYGGDDVLPLAVRLFRSSHRKLSADAAGRDLDAAVAEAAEVAGWVAYDADQLDVARALSLEALHLARLAGDRSMEVFVFANLAMIDLQQREPGEALSITAHVSEHQPAGRVGALFAVREARALAQRGERPRALDTVDRARVLLDEGIAAGDPAWSWWFDSAELSWHRATVHAELDDWPAAVDGYWEAYSMRGANCSRADGPSRRRRSDFNDLAHLVEALTAIAAWPEVEQLMPAVLAEAAEISSTRTTRVLRRATRRITRSPTTSSTVQDQAEDLSTLLAR